MSETSETDQLGQVPRNEVEFWHPAESKGHLLIFCGYTFLTIQSKRKPSASLKFLPSGLIAYAAAHSMSGFILKPKRRKVLLKDE